MKPERYPTTGAGEPAKVSIRLTRYELLELDRFCAEKKLTRSQDNALLSETSNQ